MTTTNSSRWLWLAVAAASVFALGFGIRQSQTLFISNINTTTGLGLAAVSFAYACAQLWWGVVQPFAGAAADKVGAGRVLAAGAVLICIGTVLTPFAQSTWQLVFCIAILCAGGAGMAGPSVLMGVTTRAVPAEKRGLATALVNAGGSFGQFIFAPAAQAIAAGFGWVSAMVSMGLMALAILPLAWVLRGKPVVAAAPAAVSQRPLGETVRTALRDRNFLLLAAGFFVCGFHVAFLGVHLPGVIASCTLPRNVSAWSLALIGLFNIFGSFGAGWAMGRWRMKHVLSVIYAARAVAILIFLAAPKTETTFLLFAVVMGLTFLATVPPTAGLVGKLHGVQYLGTLFGIVMLAHQLGGFTGAYLGGVVFEKTGSYNWMWYIDIVLAIGAALIHLPIREAKPVAIAKPA